MANSAGKLPVVLTQAAADDLDEIWFRNAVEYNILHADSYKNFLRARAEALSVDHDLGRPVPTRPEFRYINIRKRQGGHGHVCIYRVKNDQVDLLRFFHTRQDWQTHIAKLNM